eukprot:TRINITY_DN17102_c0_g1_i3.p1 TRINITY_DN17102_c0_g1~~TRINITY_DN17102_c0_g1_i3.p1  ORF type:complete len:573 (-),score=118.32 TRINITY_DN17102_c0_g1_i3:206-1924(-)
MPEYSESDGETTIPNLFPNKLLDGCLTKVQEMVRETGIRAEMKAEKEAGNCSESDERYQDYGYTQSPLSSHTWPSWLDESYKSSSALHLTCTDTFKDATKICREFLSTFLAGPVLDSLSESARQVANPVNPGHLFSFSVFCGDRLGRLIVHLHADLISSRNKSWANFLTSKTGTKLTLSCLSQCNGLNSLYIQHIATNDMLHVISNTCQRLTILDISYSSKVTDIGLVHLCGMLSGAARGIDKAPIGCKYLRELYFNPQNQPPSEQIMPQVISCLLRHLPMLQVVDLTNLHPGIDQYYRGNTKDFNTRSSRMKPLNLVHYTGSDRLAEVIQICPKLRTFKLFVTDSLPDLGLTLQTLGHTLDQITLVYTPQHDTLSGFQEFLQACGRRISRLDVECSTDAIIKTEDLISIASNCPQLESLSFSNFHVITEVDPRISPCPVPTVPAKFPFLRTVRFANVIIEQHGKEIYRYLVGGAHDLETFYTSFKSAGYFFSDFLLDDILAVNNLAHLEEFILKDGALTLISALRLISSRPKLRTVGRLLHWDVEPSELTTFIQILRKAKSLNLLQDITIV